MHGHSSWGVEQSQDDASLQVAGVSQALGHGPEAGDAAALVTGVQLELQADGFIDAAEETRAGVGLLFPGVFSGRDGHSALPAIAAWTRAWGKRRG